MEIISQRRLIVDSLVFKQYSKILAEKISF